MNYRTVSCAIREELRSPAVCSSRKKSTSPLWDRWCLTKVCFCIGANCYVEGILSKQQKTGRRKQNSLSDVEWGWNLWASDDDGDLWMMDIRGNRASIWHRPCWQTLRLMWEEYGVSPKAEDNGDGGCFLTWTKQNGKMNHVQFLKPWLRLVRLYYPSKLFLLPWRGILASRFNLSPTYPGSGPTFIQEFTRINRDDAHKSVLGYGLPAGAALATVGKLFCAIR